MLEARACSSAAHASQSSNRRPEKRPQIESRAIECNASLSSEDSGWKPGMRSDHCHWGGDGRQSNHRSSCALDHASSLLANAQMRTKSSPVPINKFYLCSEKAFGSERDIVCVERGALIAENREAASLARYRCSTFLAAGGGELTRQPAHLYRSEISVLLGTLDNPLMDVVGSMLR